MATDTEVTLRAGNGRIEVRSPFSEREAMKSIGGGKWDATAKCWHWPVSVTVAAALRQTGRVRAWRMLADAAFRDLVRKGEQAAKVKASPDLPQPVWRKFDAWNHQLQAFHFSRDRAGTMLDMSMGTGKSKVIVDLIQNGFEGDGGPVMRTVIIAPPNVAKDVWPGQFKQHAILPIEVVLETKGSMIKRAERSLQRVQQAEAKGIPWVVLVNYEAFWQRGLLEFLMGLDIDLLIFDESHKIKAPGGKWSKAAQRLARKAKRKLGLTGTLLPHSPLDAYAQFRAVDETVFGTSFVSFRNKYAVMGGFEGKQVVGFRNMEEFYERIASATFRATEDVLDLPPTMHEWVRLDLPAGAWKAYSSLEKNFYFEVEAGEVTASNALARLLRLRQVTSGHLPLEDESGQQVKLVTHEVKTQALIDLLDNLPVDEPVVVFAVFQHDLNEIHRAAEKAGRKSLELSGRRHELEEWKNGDAPILAVQIQSGGVGIDLTRAAYCVYYSLGFSLGEYEQSLKRLDRPGQTRSVRYYYLLMERTVDIATMRALEKRKQVVTAILNGEFRGDTDGKEQAAD